MKIILNSVNINILVGQKAVQKRYGPFNGNNFNYPGLNEKCKSNNYGIFKERQHIMPLTA